MFAPNLVFVKGLAGPFAKRHKFRVSSVQAVAWNQHISPEERSYSATFQASGQMRVVTCLLDCWLDVCTESGLCERSGGAVRKAAQVSGIISAGSCMEPAYFAQGALLLCHLSSLGPNESCNVSS